MREGGRWGWGPRGAGDEVPGQMDGKGETLGYVTLFTEIIFHCSGV